MNRYVIILPPESTISPTVISTKFPDKTYEITPRRVWAVATHRETCGDVCKEIGGGPGSGAMATAIVVKIGEYDGFAPSALWDKLSAWGIEP